MPRHFPRDVHAAILPFKANECRKLRSIRPPPPRPCFTVRGEDPAGLAGSASQAGEQPSEIDGHYDDVTGWLAEMSDHELDYLDDDM